MEYWQAQAKADECLAKGEYEQSLRHYQSALETVPDDSQRCYAVISIYIGKARALLKMDEPGLALQALHDLEEDDFQGIYQGYPEYFQTLLECEQKLDRDSRNTENLIHEQALNWREALTRARDLLDGGDAAGSLVFFERSLNDNPGEWYSMGDVNEALAGKANALRKLGRIEEARKIEKHLPKGEAP